MDFVIIANAWDAAVDNPTSKHQVALELARQGHRILWVEGAGMRRPSLASSSDRGRILQKVRRAFRGSKEVSKNIWRVAPLIIPVPSSAAVRAINNSIYRSAIASAVRKAGFVEPVLINFMPNLPDILKGWNGPSVYYCVDRWDAFGMYDSGLMARLDEQCCRNADMVIASSKDLYDRCLKHNPKTDLITHGVDYKHFASSLAEVCPSGKTIGFIGLISEWVDQDLLVKLARELKDSRIVLIGKADIPVDRLSREINIHILGPKPFAELPECISAFDVGIIPFVVNDLTRAVNPIKLREMLAAGCPVVSTDLPEVRAMEAKAETGNLKPERGKEEVITADVSAVASERRLDERRLTPTIDNNSGFAGIAVAKNSSEFVRLVKERLEKPLTIEQRRAISESVKAETWEAKVNEILGLIEQSEEKTARR